MHLYPYIYTKSVCHIYMYHTHACTIYLYIYAMYTYTYTQHIYMYTYTYMHRYVHTRYTYRYTLHVRYTYASTYIYSTYVLIVHLYTPWPCVQYMSFMQARGGGDWGWHTATHVIRCPQCRVLHPNGRMLLDSSCHARTASSTQLLL